MEVDEEGDVVEDWEMWDVEEGWEEEEREEEEWDEEEEEDSSSSTSTNETDVAPAPKRNARGRVWGQRSTSRARQARRAAQFGRLHHAPALPAPKGLAKAKAKGLAIQRQRACKSQSHRARKSQSQRWQARR